MTTHVRSPRLSPEGIDHLYSLGLKRCFKCSETKPLEDFFRNRARKDGRSSDCKSCNMQASMKWSAENAERVRARDRERYADNPGRRERIRKWQKANPDRVRAFAQRYRDTHPLEERLRGSYARAHSPEATITAEELRAYWAANGITEDRCYYTGAPLRDGWHLDHKTPLSRGGAHSVENLVPTTAEINALKGSYTAEEFIEEMLREAG